MGHRHPSPTNCHLHLTSQWSVSRLPALTRNTSIVFPSCLQHSEPPKTHSTHTSSQSPPISPPITALTMEVKASQPGALLPSKQHCFLFFRLQEVFQSLLQPLSSAAGIQNRPQTIRSKQAVFQESVIGKNRQHLTLDTLLTVSVLCHTALQVPRKTLL